MPKIIIKSVPATFNRGGKQWSREGSELDASEHTVEQLQAIAAEPNLVISDTEALQAAIDAKTNPSPSTKTKVKE